MDTAMAPSVKNSALYARAGVGQPKLSSCAQVLARALWVTQTVRHWHSSPHLLDIRGDRFHCSDESVRVNNEE
jgi:hypothetical protein